MAKLKELYDAARAADEKVQEVMNEMITAFEDGTEEGKLKALEMRPALDEAKTQADEANRLYISARDADQESENAAARKFVPASEPEGGKNAKEMTRAEFEALSAADRMTFMLSDGKLVD
jgi:hypothetical protein